jgi:MFS transporter, PAT family, beta-lactamase induction signal transducer AmpG
MSITANKTFTKPFYIFFLVLPQGLSQGFVTVALPFLLTQQGFSVASTAGIVALSVFANMWRFIWGPVVDLSLSLKKWFWIGLAVSMSTLMVLCCSTLNPKHTLFLSLIVFLSQVAGTFTLLPANGFMAKRIEEHHKGKASGWYQAGCLVGVGLGGGVGLWLAVHYNEIIAGIGICAISILSALVVILIKDIHHPKERTIIQELSVIGKDLVVIFKIPVALFAMVLIILPIGTGAAANVWSAIANDWHVNADTVALVTGILSGGISAIGCVIGGYMADKKGVWLAYLVAGAICALITMIMAIMPYKPWVYISGVLAYTFGIGLINAAFTAVILFAIGKQNVATKYSLLSSIGNIPVTYMTVFVGWAHDKYNSKIMLLAEGLVGILCVFITALVLQALKKKYLLMKPVS